MIHADPYLILHIWIFVFNSFLGQVWLVVSKLFGCYQILWVYHQLNLLHILGLQNSILCTLSVNIVVFSVSCGLNKRVLNLSENFFMSDVQVSLSRINFTLILFKADSNCLFNSERE